MDKMFYSILELQAKDGKKSLEVNSFPYLNGITKRTNQFVADYHTESDIIVTKYTIFELAITQYREVVHIYKKNEYKAQLEVDTKVYTYLQANCTKIETKEFSSLVW